MRTGFTLAGLLSISLIASPSWACTIAPAPPQRPGESADAYKIRLDKERRQKALEWLQRRQVDAMQKADLIFIARDTDWTPPYRQPSPPKARPGQPPPYIPLPVPPVIAYPAPSYFKPIDWLKGPQVRRLFRVSRADTSCGPMSLGDTTRSQPGKLYLFFARKGPVSEATLIDAIAIDKIDHPELTAFVMKYRKPPSASR